MKTDKIIEGEFNSFDETKIFYRLSKPASPLFETIMILHGQGEHSGRYLKFLDQLDSSKYAIAIMDLRGHGRSAGRHVYVDTFNDYLRDVTAFVNVLATRHGMTAKFNLFGHSLGGLISMHWAKANSERLKMLIFSSPCFGLRLPKFVIALNDFFNRIIPKMEYRNPVYPPHLTHNPQEMVEYRGDGLIRRKITVRLLAEMISYANRLQEETELAFPFPVYVLMADDLERVVDPLVTRQIFDRISAPDKKLVSFPGFYHEIFNEVDQKTAFEALRMALQDGQKHSSN